MGFLRNSAVSKHPARKPKPIGIVVPFPSSGNSTNPDSQPTISADGGNRQFAIDLLETERAGNAEEYSSPTSKVDR
jgi:hypothetical protein